MLHADYVLLHKPNIPLAVVEGKKSRLSRLAGVQQAIQYALLLGVPFIFTSNGFVFRDEALASGVLEQNITLDQFPSPEELWQRYCAWEGQTPAVQSAEAFDYSPGKTPHHDQINAINRAAQAIAAGQKRVLFVMATDTGKTFTAFQIVHRLRKLHWCNQPDSTKQKRILFLADRNILIDQTMVNDLRPFKGVMAKLNPHAKGIERVDQQGRLTLEQLDLAVNKSAKQVNQSHQIYLSLYQAVSGTEEKRNIYKQFSPEFFGLVVIDECHRGSTDEDSAWHEILRHFRSVTHVGLTATPKETADLFLVLIQHILKVNGRAAIVLPDGTLFGEGVKTRINEQLLTECNLHTIAHLPNGVFASYTGIKTNLLFFTKGQPTQSIWYYEHPYPAGARSYNKTKPIRIKEFDTEKAWWGSEADGFAAQVENGCVWKVGIEQIKAANFNPDQKNPHDADTVSHDPAELLRKHARLQQEAQGPRDQLKAILVQSLGGRMSKNTHPGQPPAAPATEPGSLADLYAQAPAVLAQARQVAQRQLNQPMALTCWQVGKWVSGQVGKLIVEHEQAGQVRAAYGARLLEDLPERLTANCGEGFSVQSLGNYRQFYLTFPTDEIRSKPWSELGWSHMKLRMRDEKDLEQGLLDQLQKLLLELGKGFAFVARQRYLRIENQDTFVDLVFDNLIHRCFVPIELKVGKLSHQDVGQLDMHVRVFDEQVRQTGDNPTIGLVLCSERNEAVVRYPSLTGSDQISASRYQPWLTTEAKLQAELALGRALMEMARSDTP